LAFAVIFAVMFATAALALAIIRSVAVMGRNSHAVPLTSALIRCPGLAFVFARIEPPANMGILQQSALLRRG
jgi:hypothetical protein